MKIAPAHGCAEIDINIAANAIEIAMSPDSTHRDRGRVVIRVTAVEARCIAGVLLQFAERREILDRKELSC